MGLNIISGMSYDSFILLFVHFSSLKLKNGMKKHV